MSGKTGIKHIPYTDKFRASAVLLAEAAGYPNTEGAISRTARKLQVPVPTLRGWVRQGIKYGAEEIAEEVEELMEETRTELTDLFEKEIRAIAVSMDTARLDASYRDLGIVLGILTDKRQLLNDKPTQNVQQAISFERRGITTLPEYITSGAIEGPVGEEEIQRP